LFAGTKQTSQRITGVQELAQPALLEPISEDSLEPELSLYAGSTLAGSRCSDNSDSVITFKKYQAQNKDLNYDPTKDENLKDSGTPNVQLSGTIEDGRTRKKTAKERDIKGKTKMLNLYL
jgi:hypothetical protein